jgi:hypothetical protein
LNTQRNALSALILAATTSAVLFSAPAFATQNLFKNPGFNGGLHGWNVNIVNPNEDAIRWVSSGGDGMGSSARFYSDGDVNPAWHMQLAQRVAVDAGDVFTVQFDVATTGQSNRNVALYVQQDGGQWTRYAEQTCYVPVTGIAHCQLTAKAIKTENVNFGIKGADNLWDFTVDNAQLTKVPASTTNLLSNIHFADPAFAHCVLSSGARTIEELQELSCDPQFGTGGITDVSGIEKLTALVFLGITNNQITSIDLSGNPLLEGVNLSDNQLTSVNLSNNSKLWALHLSHNQLSSLDVSNNPSLLGLDASYNELTSIDLTNNAAIINLEVSFNPIDQLDFSTNIMLSQVRAVDTALTCATQQQLVLDYPSIEFGLSLFEPATGDICAQ